jgi:very-short-patch-repair endonuclease
VHHPSYHSSIDDIVAHGLLAWPDQSATALQEEFEDALRGRAAVLCLPLSGAAVDLDGTLNDLLRTFTAVVVALFPAWLPEAAGIEGRSGASLTAIKGVARSAARLTDFFTPFLLRIASAALKQEKTMNLSGFPREVIVRECAKLMRRAFSVEKVILILTPTAVVSDEALSRVERAAIWLHEHGSLIVWLAGPSAAHMLRIPRIGSTPLKAVPLEDADERVIIHITPLAGRPNPLSRAEQKLEARLSSLSWAAGRAWNQSWAFDALHNPIYVDLIWNDGKCVVEIDGPDHLDPAKFAADRRRDRLLQLAGFKVLRFTNDEVLDDIEQVTSLLERVVTRKKGNPS